MTENNQTDRLIGFDVDPLPYTKEDNSWILKSVLPVVGALNALMMLWALIQPSSFIVPSTSNNGNPNIPFIISLLVLAVSIGAVVFMLHKVMIDMTLAGNRAGYFVWMVTVLLLGALNSWFVFGPTFITSQ